MNLQTPVPINVHLSAADEDVTIVNEKTYWFGLCIYTTPMKAIKVVPQKKLNA
jgi:hypothetical protein